MFIESDALGHSINPPVKTATFKNTNPARIEQETIIWALNLAKGTYSDVAITLYTDSKTVEDLPKRRNRLESKGFMSKSKGTVLKNADLYIKLFALFDDLQPTIVWTKGHKSTKLQTHLENLFSLVDKETRRVLRATRHHQVPSI